MNERKFLIWINGYPGDSRIVKTNGLLPMLKQYETIAYEIKPQAYVPEISEAYARQISRNDNS